jgi:NADH:ubiquinone oxidoreductase subunit E
MGSSCFARGNSQTLQALETFLRNEGLADQVELVGHLCLGACSKGPNVRIGDQAYRELDAEGVVALVKQSLTLRKQTT